MHYNIPPHHLTPVFHKLNAANTRFVINYGGTGSGKSYAAAQKELLKSCVRPGIKTLVVRKVAATLKDSVIPCFLARISELGMDGHFIYNKTDAILTNIYTQSQLIFRGLDDPDKLKSFEGLERILVEEAAELSFEDYLELNRRARGREQIQLTLCFNPVHEEHWLKKHFFDMNIADCTILHSTYQDNPYLTDTDRQQIQYLQQYDHNQYRIYALGEWGLRQNDMAWLHAFNTHTHLSNEVRFLDEFPVYLSFDFNRQPATCIAVQMSPNYRQPGSFVHFIKEFAADVQLSELCARIRHTFPHSILHVTGDASGARGDVGYQSRHSSYYGMIQNYLGVSPQNMRLLSANLPHNHSRYLLNAVFAEHGGIRISRQGCPGLVNDCIIARVDDSTHKPGMLRKDRHTYKMDLFDAMRYFFQAWFGNYNGILHKLYLKPQSLMEEEE